MTFEISASLLAGFRAWQVVQEDKKAWKNPKASLHYLMFSQGLLYVVPVFILSVSSLALNFEVPFQFSRALNAVKLPLLGLLTARFILQLRKWEHKKKTVVVFELPTIRSDSGIQADAAVVNCQPLASASPSSPGQRRESLRSGTTGASWTRIVSREWWATVLSAKKEANALEEYGADIGPRHGSWVRRLRRERLGAHAADTEHNE
ncbi:hypothetical protein FA15DRAFT_709311 [Coprinopsis marcescibilis]|uniref:Uncharacterized protein n=1 Tax=Coprinopsis marcescibilis TaxID=230819 RepID=A0A5C3KFZ4_COPMA|nr:hypothetical protein FA15DRAFT_709311 [Coprinopsis marcescibilis]